MKEIKLQAPAKINIGLNITERRKDGYHNIETIFYPVQLSDEITIRESENDHFVSNDPVLKTDKTNLIIHTKMMIEKYTGWPLPAYIELNKRIPVSAGLGGGSSDAAAVLKGLNEVFDLKIPRETLLKFALKLGSDVPFFIDSVPCYGSGRGEKLFPVKLKISYPVLLVNPGIFIPTRWAYFYVKPSKPEKSLRDFIDAENPFESLLESGILKNDFEPVVFRKHPEIKRLKHDLQNSGAMISLMSGSGSTVFGIFKDLETAKEAERLFEKRYFVFLHHTP
ncbi:MAG: 4-(cytidine 5'-diphospho)-2-C-methyl-D-erythritol kinase [Ignavibacteriaceae bacterium]